MTKHGLSRRLTLTTAIALALVSSGTAHANDGPAPAAPAPPTSGGKHGKDIYASATYSHIKVRQVSGPTGGKRGALSSVDVNWKPRPAGTSPSSPARS